MLKKVFIQQCFSASSQHVGRFYKWSSWLLLLLVLTAGCAQAQAPDATYSEPLVISKGGTYTGNFRSTSSSTPVVTIKTTEPVILQNCTLVGPGELIMANNGRVDLTVRECRGYGTTPTADNTPRGPFLYMLQGKNLVLEHNYLETNRGIVLDRWAGDGSSGQTVKIRYNQALNLIGTSRNNTQGFSNFVLLNTILNLPNLEVAWNQVINEPNKSRVEDNINLSNSGGTPASPARVHDNYVQGAYPLPATSTGFSGTGFTTDGDGTTPSTVSAFIEVDHNQFVSTCNAGINMAAGHDINVHDNRVVTSGFLSSGEKLGLLSCGITPFNYYNSPASTFGNIRVADNVVGYANFSASNPHPNRNDYNLALATTVSGNVSLPPGLTVQTEQNEWTLWQQKLKQNGVTPGPTGGTATPNPTLTTPTTPTTTAPAPTAPANATFYRAFDLNGGSLTLDGNKWEAGAATGLQVTGGTNFTGQNTLNPATDATRAGLILSSVYGSQVAATVSNVPNASYLIFLYVWEDNNAETFNILVNGQVAQANYNSGAAGHWDRLGPYKATVANGTLTVGTNGGTANVSGLELWTVNGTTATTPAPTTPTTSTPTPTPNSFYRAFDLNGGATTIDGNKWEAGSAVQVANGTNFVGSGPALSPAADAARTTMLRSSVYGSRVQLTVPGLPNASYAVYLHVWEDNNAETFSILVNGQVAQANYNSGAAGHWDRLGPYPATVTNGTLTVSVNGGTANLSGLEIWTAGGTTTPTPAPTTTTSFYRAIDLNGSAMSIDGNSWEGSAAPNYSANGNRFSLQSQALTPGTDANRAAMLRSCQYSNSLDFRMTAVPSGTYLVSAYVWEDNFTETYSLALNGQTVASNLQTGAAGTWAKVGPYPVTVSNGTIQLTTSGGTVNLSGVEVWQQVAGSSASLASTASSAARSAVATAPASLYPNPLGNGQSRVQVEATVAQAEQVVVQVITHMGTLLRQATLNFPAGLSSQLLEVGDLAPGTYVVRFASGSLLGKTIGLVKSE